MSGAAAVLVVLQATAAALVAAAMLAGPGLFILRRARWSAEEILAAAPALSLVAVGLARFAFFSLRPGPWVGPAVGGACLALAVAAAVRLARRWTGGADQAAAGGPTERAAVGAALGSAALLAAWVALLAGLVRNYGAGNWNTDWMEHYLRARFFLGGQPFDQTFVGAPLAARPPLLNLFAAGVLDIAGRGYPQYQAAVAVAAVAGFFAVLLLARGFAAAGPRDGATARLAPVVGAWLMLNPMFVENATYPWTKAVAAWMVVAAAALYLRGRRAADPGRVVAAFAIGAGAILTHYSAGPYVALMAAHYLALEWRARPGRGRELAAVAAVAAAVLGPWLLFTAALGGPAAAITSTASYRDAAAHRDGSHAAKIALNIRDTVVPNFARGVSTDARATASTWGGLREAAFMAYQSNLLAAPGLLGLVLLAAAALRRDRRAGGDGGGARAGPGAGDAPFWIGFVAAGLVIGIAAHGARDRAGLAHLVLQPIVLAILARLAAGFPSWPRAWRVAALAGLGVDLLLGIALHFWLQSYPLDLPGAWTGLLGLTLTDLSIGYTESNWMLKAGGGLRFAGDALAPLRPLLAIAAAVVAAAGFARLAGAGRGTGAGGHGAA